MNAIHGQLSLLVFTMTDLHWHCKITSYAIQGRAPALGGSVLDHRSLLPVFESRCGHIWRLFHLWLRFITVRGRSTYLVYHVLKSARKTPIIIIWCYTVYNYYLSSDCKEITDVNTGLSRCGYKYRFVKKLNTYVLRSTQVDSRS